MIVTVEHEWRADVSPNFGIESRGHAVGGSCHENIVECLWNPFPSAPYVCLTKAFLSASQACWYIKYGADC